MKQKMSKVYSVITSSDMMGLYIISFLNYLAYIGIRYHPGDDGSGMIALMAVVCDLALLIRIHLFIKGILG